MQSLVRLGTGALVQAEHALAAARRAHRVVVPGPLHPQSWWRPCHLSHYAMACCPFRSQGSATEQSPRLGLCSASDSGAVSISRSELVMLLAARQCLWHMHSWSFVA